MYQIDVHRSGQGLPPCSCPDRCAPLAGSEAPSVSPSAESPASGPPNQLPAAHGSRTPHTHQGRPGADRQGNQRRGEQSGAQTQFQPSRLGITVTPTQSRPYVASSSLSQRYISYRPGMTAAGIQEREVFLLLHLSRVRWNVPPRRDGLTVNPRTRTTQMVTVTSGANSNDLDGLAGQTVGAVRQALASIFNIAADAVATLNGDRTSNDQILNEGDELSFSRAVAQKGV